MNRSLLQRRRTRAIFGAAAVGGLCVVGLPFAAGGPPDEGDAIVRDARHAAADHDFGGTISLQWYDGETYHSDTMPVRSVDGVIEIEGERTVVTNDDGGYVLDANGWHTLWQDRDTADAPDPSAKYALDVSTTLVGGRATNLVEIRDADNDTLRERRFFDDETGIVLRREQFDDDGRAVRVLTLRRIDTVVSGPGGGVPDTPSPPDDSAPGDADGDAPESVGDGWRLQSAESVSTDTTQLHYTDGVFGLSVSVTDGGLDWDALPPNGHGTELDGHEARRWQGPGGTVAVWEMDGTTFAVVTDAPDSDLAAVVDDFEAPDPLLGRMMRFAISPFSLF